MSGVQMAMNSWYNIKYLSWLIALESSANDFAKLPVDNEPSG
jgi:hypothetical protein